MDLYVYIFSAVIKAHHHGFSGRTDDVCLFLSSLGDIPLVVPENDLKHTLLTLLLPLVTYLSISPHTMALSDFV